MTILTGCVSQDYLDAKQDADSVHQQIQTLTPHADTTRVKTITHPPVDIQVVHPTESIAWLHTPIAIKASHTPLSLVLSNVLTGLDLSVSFDDAIDPNQPITVAFSGTRGDILNLIAAQAHIAFDPHPHKLHVIKFVAKTFEINIPTGQYTAQLGSQGKATGSDQNPHVEGQFINVAYKNVDVVSDIATGIRAILKADPKNGPDTETTKTTGDSSLVGEVQVIPSLSSISVRTTPERMRKVESLVNRYQRELSKQVLLNIQVLEFRSNLGHEKGIDWNVVRNTAHGALQFFIPGTNTVSLDAGYGLAFKGVGQWNGTNSFIKVLEKQGTVSTKTPVTALVLNNQPARISQTLTKPYLSNISSESSEGVVSSSVTRDKQTEGVDMMVTPNVKNQFVWLRISGKLTKIASDHTEDVNNIKLRFLDTRESQITFTNKLRYGQTYVIGSVKQTSTTAERNESFWLSWLGGMGSKVDTVETLVLLTPTRVDN
nr:hypothetical protein [Vibrio sp. 23023]